ncbi:MAG: DUF938 domain-containing protein [Amphiplicatus sp.]
MKKTPPIALETRNIDGARLFSPSAARNRDPIRAALLASLTLKDGVILEIGSGTGEHVTHFAAATPGLRWLPGDPDSSSRASVAAWTAHAKLSNIAPPHAIDVTTEGWERALPPLDGVVSINMIHIAPIEAARGLIKGAGTLLRARGVLFLYGPFSRCGAHTAPSNAEFDANLKRRDPRWGVRDLENDIIPLAREAGLSFYEARPMPANNFSIIFNKRPAP